MIHVIKNYNLSDISNSIKYLLDKSAHSMEVRSLAIEITSSSQDKISTVHQFIKNEVSYVSDPLGIDNNNIELFISPIRMVRDYWSGLRPGGDCDDHALFATALYRSIGIPSNVVIVDSIGEGIDHAFSEVWSDKLNNWIDVDTTTEYPLGWVHEYHSRTTI